MEAVMMVGGCSGERGKPRRQLCWPGCLESARLGSACMARGRLKAAQQILENMLATTAEEGTSLLSCGGETPWKIMIESAAARHLGSTRAVRRLPWLQARIGNGCRHAQKSIKQERGHEWHWARTER